MCRARHPRSVTLRQTEDGQGENNKEPAVVNQNEAPQEPSKNKEPEVSMEDKMNDFLDKEFFNPKDVPEGSPLRWFADLVENDYATAEALYASFFIAGMVLITQELVRMQLYGDQYIPFQKVGSGTLF